MQQRMLHRYGVSNEDNETRAALTYSPIVLQENGNIASIQKSAIIVAKEIIQQCMKLTHSHIL